MRTIRRIYKIFLCYVCTITLLFSVVPVFAANADSTDMLIWLDDMSKIGFDEDVQSNNGMSDQCLLESVIHKVHEGELEWSEAGYYIDIMGDGLSFFASAYPYPQDVQDEVMETILTELPYVTSYQYDSYASREEPLTVRTITVNNIDYKYVSGPITTRKVQVGLNDSDAAIDVLFFFAKTFVGDWQYTFRGAATLGMYETEEALAEAFLKTVHYRDAGEQVKPGIGEVAVDFIPTDVQFHFYSGKQKTAETTYSDRYFSVSGYQYQSDMAETSMAMAMAAYNYEADKNAMLGAVSGYRNIEEMMGQMGFFNLYHNYYYQSDTKTHSTGVAIGIRLINGKTVLAVAVRGGNYDDEWAGNFTVGGSDMLHHDGFERGKKNVVKAIKEYIETFHVMGDIKIWITGYSRGAAIANLTAAELDRGIDLSDDVHYTAEDVYAYCFEVPANTTDTEVGDPLYANIFNIINPIDPVPRLAPAQWGFSRYGYNVYIPALGLDASYQMYISDVKKLFKVWQPNVSDMQFNDQINILNRLIMFLVEAIPERNTYVKEFQSGIVDVIQEGEINFLNGDNIWTSLWYGFNEEQMSLLGNFLKRAGWYSLTEDEILDNFEGVDLTLEDDTDLRYWWAMVLDKLLTDTLSGRPIFDSLDLDANTTDEELNRAMDAVVFSHYPEWTFSWMRVLNGTGILERTMEANGHSVKTKYASLMVHVHCPVDVSVTDIAGETLAVLYADESANIPEGSPINAYFDETGAKVFVIPVGMQIAFDIQATEDGIMSVNLKANEVATCRCVRYDHFNQLELKQGEHYNMNLNSGEYGSDYQFTLTDPKGDVRTPDISTAMEEPPVATVRAVCDENGIVTAQETGYIGEFLTLYAYPYDGYVIDGWYDAAGVCVGTDRMLTVQAEDDAEYYVRFRAENHQTNMWIAICVLCIGVLAAVSIVVIYRNKRAC